MIVRTGVYAAAIGITVLGLTGLTASHAQRPEPSVAWPFAGGNIENTHAAGSGGHLGPDTVGGLKLKWVFTTAGNVSATPTLAGDSLFVPDWGGKLYRIDITAGTAVWTHSISDYTGISTSLSRNAPAITPDAIILGDQASGMVMALSRQDGSLLWKTMVDDHSAAIITSSPVVFDGKVYVGVASHEEGLAATPGYKVSFRGSVASLDLHTGRLLWQLRTVPEHYTGGAVWGSNLAIDRRAGALEVGTGNNYSIPDEVRRCIDSAELLTQKIACLSPDDHTDSILSLDLATGAIKWSRRFEGPDVWTTNCIADLKAGVPCPDPVGPDYDFGSAPNFFTAQIRSQLKDVVGAGQKSGIYWALDARTGEMLWGTQVGPGGTAGGIEWGTAVDGKRIYVAVNNYLRRSFTLAGTNQKWAAGSWAALDAATGNIVWQVPATGQNPLVPAEAAGALGSVTTVNGVVLAGSLSGDMVALDASTGKTLWKFASGGSVASSPSVAGDSIYWGSGYTRFGFGTGNNKLFAFHLPGSP